MKNEVNEITTVEETMQEWKEYQAKVNRNWFTRLWYNLCAVPSKIKNSIHERKLKHLKIGKPKYVDGKLYITGVSWDVHWQTADYLTAIIRDYLKIYLKNAPIIGNVAYGKNLCAEQLLQAQEKISNEQAEQIWKDMLQNAINLFDVLSDAREYDLATYQQKVDEAFDTLKKIYADLNW